MDLQNKLRAILQNELQTRKSKNSRYSLRAFASFLQVDHSLLNKFLREQKSIGQKNLLSICKRLDLEDALAKELRQALQIPPEKRQLDLEDHELLKEWYYYPLLELMMVKRKKPHIASVAKKLGISATDCKKAVDAIVKAGIFGSEDNDDLSAQFDFVVNYHGTETMKRSQRDFMKKSLAALEHWTPDKRTTLGLTVGIETSQLPLLTAEIRKFQRRLNRLAAKRKRINSIYQLQISLFPLMFLD